jgi:hypothetical protein
MRLARIAAGVTIFTAAVTCFAASDAPPKLAGPSRHYTLKLNSLFTPQAPVSGVFLKVRIDGGPALRLLLDSGAEYIVLDKRAASSSGRAGGSTMELVGLGTSSKVARRVSPGTVEIGDLVLRDCAIAAVDTPLIEGIDGVVPLSLFAGFLVRLDVPGKTLDLDPYPPDPPVQDGSYSPARADDRLLFLQAIVNESHSGYVLLDTGAAYNAVAPAAAEAWKSYPLLSPRVSLRGGTGVADGFLLPSGVRFRFGSQVLSADPAVVVDFSEIARRLPFEVAGVLGYSALRRSIVTVDYRDAMVRITGK